MKCYKVVVALLILSTALQAAEFTVAPNGKDSNPGTAEKPFATLQRAQEAVRKDPDRGIKPMTVTIAGGTVEAYAIRGEFKSGLIKIHFGISKQNWKVLDVDSESTQQENGRAANAIDGDPDTIWHSQSVTGKPNHPHYIAIDLDQPTRLAGFSYLPRKDRIGGTIFGYEFYLSQDGKNWGQPVAKGEFDNIENNPTQQNIHLEKAQQVRFIKLVSTSAIQNQPSASAAEIGIFSN